MKREAELKAIEALLAELHKYAEENKAELLRVFVFPFSSQAAGGSAGAANNVLSNSTEGAATTTSITLQEKLLE